MTRGSRVCCGAPMEGRKLVEEACDRRMNIVRWGDLCRRLDPRRTAIVGNAAAVRQAGLGRGVDEASLIVRFNRARTRGFEHLVGSRTDLLICSLHVFETGGQVKQAVEASAVLAFVGREKEPANLDEFEEAVGDTPVCFSFFPEILPSLPLRRSQPFTTGTYGLHVLLQHLQIEQLLICGFNFYSGSAGENGHYWETAPPPAPLEHDLRADRDAFKELLQSFDGQLELSPELARVVEAAETVVSGKHKALKPALLRSLAGTAAWRLLRMGMALRRWSNQ